MNLGITIKLAGSPRMNTFASFLTRGERDEILRKVGAKLKFLTVKNFGYYGSNRPSEWKSLSASYAKKVNRTEATLDTDIGRSPYKNKSTGELIRSIFISCPDGNSISVYTDNKYASAHQKGATRKRGGVLPPRPFFPINRDGSATPYAQRVLETTAKIALQEQMRSLK